MMRLALTLTSKEPVMLEVRKGNNRPEKFPSRSRTLLWWQALLIVAASATKSSTKELKVKTSRASCPTSLRP